MTPAVFLDRDGTICEERGYTDRVERLILYPWSVDAIGLLRRAGYRVCLVTNQAGIAKGMFPESFIAEAHGYLEAKMAAAGTHIDGYYYCPHLPGGEVAQYAVDCDCRKPRAGMLRRAAQDHDIDLSRSFMIGDKWVDVQAGRAAGTRTILLRTGYGATEERYPRPGVHADFVANQLMEATAWILQQPGRPEPEPTR
jgi:D-glycero-D-manno-heptose 1,7-bisphosphate phosphatase